MHCKRAYAKCIYAFESSLTGHRKQDVHAKVTWDAGLHANVHCHLQYLKQNGKHLQVDSHFFCVGPYAAAAG